MGGLAGEVRGEAREFWEILDAPTALETAGANGSSERPSFKTLTERLMTPLPPSRLSPFDFVCFLARPPLIPLLLSSETTGLGGGAGGGTPFAQSGTTNRPFR